MANLTPQYIDGMMANQEMERSSKFWDSYRPSFFPFVLGNCFHLWFQVSLKVFKSGVSSQKNMLHRVETAKPPTWSMNSAKKSEPPQCPGELLFKVRPPVGCLGWQIIVGSTHFNKQLALGDDKHLKHEGGRLGRSSVKKGHSIPRIRPQRCVTPDLFWVWYPKMSRLIIIFHIDMCHFGVCFSTNI
jgi:hypothetical protein